MTTIAWQPPMWGSVAQQLSSGGGGGGGPPVVTFTTQTKVAGATDFTMTFPAGIASGDFLMAILSGDSTTGANPFTTPAGWTLELHQGSVISDSTISIYTKVANGSESGDIVFGTEGTLDQVGALIRVTNIDPTGIEATGTALLGEGFTTVVPSVTTLTDGALVFAVAAWDGGDSGGFTIGVPYTLLTSLTADAAAGISQGIGTYTMATAGATGTATLSTVSGAFEGHTGIQIALKPAA